MPDIIQLLPDSVANQIAAGEVIQRPASVVKELVENAVDAGATEIMVLIRDAGKALIQVIDNGCGMSETDARMAFERHATSKIRKAEDLFSIRTMGFRGEALASIAAVAQLEIKTRKQEDTVGTLIQISGSKVEMQEPVSCTSGTNIIVKNLFFNIPARRRFLKTNTTELRHLTIEFQRIALTMPQISFSLDHNGSRIYQLPPVQSLPQRLAGIFGKGILPNLIPLQTETSIVKISGFIGKPEFARKTFGEQFFFVNHRYMRHPYLHKALTEAFEEILPPDAIPSYFVYFDIDPNHIDINIHPTKTEIKFEDERAIWQILHASVREALGKFNIIPSIDFNTEGIIDIPMSGKRKDIHPPTVDVDWSFNPFDSPKKTDIADRSKDITRTQDMEHWEKLYESSRMAPTHSVSKNDSAPTGPETAVKHSTGMYTQLLQIKLKYILVPVKSGLMVIDQKRAHERILFEEFLVNKEAVHTGSQKHLFPKTVELQQADSILLSEILEDLNQIGFDIKDLGNGQYIINGYPEGMESDDPVEMIDRILEAFKISQSDPKISHHEHIAASLAQAMAIPYGRSLNLEEMHDLVDRLFASKHPNYSPSGKKVLILLPADDFEKKFDL